MAALFAHQKQYVIGPEPIHIRPDWKSVAISEGLVLSHCPKLRATRLRSRDGVDYHLLGLAVRADEPMSTIPEAFATKDAAEIEQWSGFWAGKWLLVSGDRCWQDASGLQGITSRGVDGRMWISNSPNLLALHLPGAPPAPQIPWRITDRVGMDWVPAPFTSREGIARLLPLRSMDLRTGEPRPVRFDTSNLHAGDDAAPLALALTTLMTNWARSGFTERMIGLTAGRDTRTVLAAVHAMRIDVRTYTNTYSCLTKRDRILPPRLAALVGVPHELRRPPKLSAADVAARSAAIAEHVDGLLAHPSFAYLAQHGVDHGPGSSFAVGNCFEVGQCSFWPRLIHAGLGAAIPSGDELLDLLAADTGWRPAPRALWRQAMRHWTASLADPVPLALDWRDRFYLEQRLGCWSNNIQRGSELLDGIGFAPANCLWMFHLLQQAGPERRLAGALQEEAIRLLSPRLMELPVNPPPLLQRLKIAAKSMLGPRAVHGLKSLAHAMKLRKAVRCPRLLSRLGAARDAVPADAPLPSRRSTR